MFDKKIKITDQTIDIAKSIIDKCLWYGYKINISKLQKLMIIAYGEYLTKTGKKLFDSKIVVHRGDLMIPDISDEFKQQTGWFDKTFRTDRLLLADEMSIIVSIIKEHGAKDVFELDTDPRIVELGKYKRVNKAIADKYILKVFTQIPKPKIETCLLCSASEKGKWIINACLNHGFEIGTVKLEKLLILAYGEYLVKTGKKLFNEDIVIWKVGPMIKEVDRDFLRYAMGFTSLFIEYYLSRKLLIVYYLNMEIWTLLS